MYKLHLGNNKEVLKDFEENSIDSIVTDPPYELGFMGKSWDSTGIAYDVELWKECLRVLKPGGYILAFSGTRTYHRMAVAIEDAGFEIRDMIEWVYGSGFPKSHNIGKKVDEIQGNEREVGGKSNSKGIKSGAGNYVGDKYECSGYDITKGTSEYEGWGTALKPAHEPICMARKPLSEKTVAENCLKWRTGGINIDESRVGYVSEEEKLKAIKMQDNPSQDIRNNSYNKIGIPNREENVRGDYSQGRFPANLIHDNSEEVRECFPETKNGGKLNAKRETKDSCEYDTGEQKWGYKASSHLETFGGDSGNASRFFKSIIYQAKPSKAERNRGCEAVFNLFEQSEGLEEKELKGMNASPRENHGEVRDVTFHKNNHPTVKPIALMEYLIKMVTPKSGIVLDPFNGSGSTGCAAVKNGFDYHGIDITKEYITISEKRIKAY